MHHPNKRGLQVLAILLFAAGSWAQNSTPPASGNTSPQSSTTTPGTTPPAATAPRTLIPPVQTVAMPAAGQAGAPGTASSQNQPGTQPPSNEGGAPSTEENGTFVFRKSVSEVVLHATVVDDKGRLITNLPKEAFTVYENGQQQAITSFRHEDVPVAIGIVIDNSGSMRDKREKVNAAAINLVKSSNPQDQVFVVNFNDEYYLDQDFTGSIPKLQEALNKVESRGGTAMYDALVASADHLMKNSKLSKKVIFVVTDGEDNASRETLEQAVKRLSEENGPTVYAIGLLGEEKARRARRALEEIAQHTGGVAFLPKNVDEVDQISKTIAHDIRNQYTIGYKPTTPKSAGGYRTIKVAAKEKGYNKLSVRTRTGYYPGQESSGQ